MSDKIQELKMNELKDMFFYTFGIVPLQNYGVVGDGMTDNRLKIQQAIYDAIEVKAKYIFVPKGNYYYSQELFRADEVAWLGNSVDAHIKGIEIKQFPSFDNVVNITDAYSENKQDTYSATYINNEIDKKVDKIDGKDLSTNDFTDEYKQKIDNKVDMVEGKNLSSNDFTDEYKQKLDNSINVKNEYSESTNDTYSSDYINKKIDEKVDKVEGKDLSSNDFTDEYKQKLDNTITVENDYTESTTSTYSANYINNKVDKVEGKGLSTNDFTDEYKQKVDNANTYSTEEQVIGIWIDGKPIYRNIIKATLPTNQESWTMIASNVVSNIDFLVNLYGIYDTTDTKFIFPKGEGSYHINAQIQGTDLYCIRKGWNSVEAMFIIEYTKTTD